MNNIDMQLLHRLTTPVAEKLTVEQFVKLYNELQDSDVANLSDIIATMKQQKLAELLSAAQPATAQSRGGVAKYETDEERRLARNEASRRCKAKKAAELAELKAKLAGQ